MQYRINDAFPDHRFRTVPHQAIGVVDMVLRDRPFGEMVSYVSRMAGLLS